MTMKRIFIIFSLLVLVLTSYSQDEVETDYLDVTTEITLRDSTLLEIIDANAPSGTARNAGNALRLVGNDIDQGGDLDSSMVINGNGWNYELGTVSSNIANFKLYTSGQAIISSGSSVSFEANGIPWAFNGTFWYSINGDTLTNFDDVRELIAASEPQLPFNWGYNFSSTITDSRPGVGLFRLDNATLANVTEIYIDYFDADGVAKNDFISMIDTGSSVSVITDENNYALYKATEGYIDNSNYFTYKVTYQSHSGVISGLSTIDLDISNSTGSGGGATASYESIQFDTASAFNNTQILFIDPIVTDTVKTTVITGDNLFLNLGTTQKAGAFDKGTTNPTNTNRFNYDGNLWASGFYKYGSGAGVNVTSADNSNAGYFHSNGTGTGITAISTQGYPLIAKNYQTPTANNSSDIIYLERTTNSTTYDLTGNIINIVDNPTTSGTVSGAVLSATIDGTERISLNPRASNYPYVYDTDDPLIGGYHTGWEIQGTEIMNLYNNGFLDLNGVRSLSESEAVVLNVSGEIGFSILGQDKMAVDGNNDSLSAYRLDASFESIKINSQTLNGTTVTDIIPSDSVMENTPVDSLNVGGHTIRFNASEGVHEFLTAKAGVVWQGALEDLVQVYNSTGSIVTNGTPFFLGGSNGDSIATIGVSSANLPQAKATQGLITGEIGIGEWGFGAVRGKVRGLNTTSLSLFGVTWLSDDSTFTATAPAYPSEKVIIGGAISIHATEGVIYVSPSLGFVRQLKTKSYSFTSSSIAAGSYWKAGFYDSPVTDANLTQASASITYGTADIAYEAHPFAVYGGVGSVTGGGRVALITTGTSYDDVTGTQTPADVDTIINDITNTVLNIYDEAKKYLGTVTYQLVIAEGAPSAYSLDFNYGYAKYDDINDRDFYITALECVWLGDGTDAAGFDVELYKHTQTGWTYSAGAFSSGNGIIAARSTDQAGFLRVVSGQESAWKRSALNTFIEGDGNEGFLIKVTTGSITTIQTMDIHVEVAID